jgi:hypothetical protein
MYIGNGIWPWLELMFARTVEISIAEKVRIVFELLNTVWTPNCWGRSNSLGIAGDYYKHAVSRKPTKLRLILNLCQKDRMFDDAVGDGLTVDEKYCRISLQDDARMFPNDVVCELDPYFLTREIGRGLSALV